MQEIKIFLNIYFNVKIIFIFATGICTLRFPVKINFKFIFLCLQNYKILSFYFFKKSTIWGTFSKTFCDWYLRFEGGVPPRYP